MSKKLQHVEQFGQFTQFTGYAKLTQGRAKRMLRNFKRRRKPVDYRGQPASITSNPGYTMGGLEVCGRDKRGRWCFCVAYMNVRGGAILHRKLD